MEEALRRSPRLVRDIDTSNPKVYRRSRKKLQVSSSTSMDEVPSFCLGISQISGEKNNEEKNNEEKNNEEKNNEKQNKKQKKGKKRVKEVKTMKKSKKYVLLWHLHRRNSLTVMITSSISVKKFEK
ncbi:hypothetical protein EJD97_023708 [Solanum chilense]|uniref:Uncharacterized protein n=1 Tax=Solanum chilense TaxID=4083 RepID=A0A6N2AEQ7_SOLCI|nr:hypothetical protein EJD97_023708 [Solanum chilense]